MKNSAKNLKKSNVLEQSSSFQGQGHYIKVKVINLRSRFLNYYIGHQIGSILTTVDIKYYCIGIYFIFYS